MTGSLHIFALSLARLPERWAHLSARLAALGLGAERVEAVDARSVSASALRERFGASAAFPATAGDMACALGHLAIWERIAALGDGAAIVLEDDATPSAAFAAFAGEGTLTLMRRHDMGLLKLEAWPGPQRSRRFPLGSAIGPAPGGTTLFRLQSGFLGSCAYVLTAHGARALLARYPVPRVPVDHLLFGRAAGMGFALMRPGFVNPAPVLHDLERFGSEIAAERAKAPRTLRRRWRDWSVRRSEAALVRRGVAAPVEMRFSDAAEPFGDRLR